MSRAMNVAWLVICVGMTILMAHQGMSWMSAWFGFLAGARLLMAMEPRP